MIRTAALLIVLALVGHAPLEAFCKAWCRPEAAAATGCHPSDEIGVSHLAGDDCDDASAEVAAALPEDGRRDVAAAALPAGSRPLLLHAPRATGLQISAGPHDRQVSVNRPRSTHLRI